MQYVQHFKLLSCYIFYLKTQKEITYSVHQIFTFFDFADWFCMYLEELTLNVLPYLEFLFPILFLCLVCPNHPEHIYLCFNSHKSVDFQTFMVMILYWKVWYFHGLLYSEFFPPKRNCSLCFFQCSLYLKQPSLSFTYSISKISFLYI